jgi:flagellar biosynthesis protein FlhF
LIDGPGVNPFRRDEMVALSALVRRVPCEPVLVLPAGLDPEDCAELAANFQVLGVRRMITTRLDAARRLGGVLAAAELGLELALAATSPLIGKPLLPWSAAGLARLVLARAGGRPGDGP